MLEIRTILVPVDFSDCSEPALAQAAAIAEKFASRVDLLHVWDVPALLPPEVMVTGLGPSESSLIDLMRQRSAEELEKFAAAAAKRGIPIGEMISLPGEASRVIIEVAEKSHYDLLVLGTHGRSGFAHALLGSVAEKVVRRAPCPVLTVRAP